MTAVDPFWLFDKINPEDDNDPEEVIKAANAADDLTRQRKPERTVNALDEDEAFDSIRSFQRSRNLTVDGIVNPKGPTAQRMAAEKHGIAERANRPAFVEVFGRGARAPLWGSVGRGGQNLRGDVQVAKAALTLTGQKVSTPDPVPGSNEDLAGGEAAGAALTRFQRQHGLKPDGVMTPFGETHDMLNTILAPRIEALAGRDPGNPKPFESREPRVVGRIMKFRPTTVLSSFQDDDSLPTEAEHRAATELMSAIAKDVEFERARAEDRAARIDDSPLSGGEGDERLTGGMDEAEIAAEAEAEAEERQLSVAMARVALIAPDLTPGEIEEAARQAVETGAIELPNPGFRDYVRKVARVRHDHADDLRNGIASGRMTTGDLEKRLESQTGDRLTAVGNRERKHRTEATMEVLAEQYIAEAAAEGIEIDRDAALVQVRRLMAAVTADEPLDLELLSEILLTAIDFVPIVGEMKSAYEAVEIYRRISELQANDPDADTTALFAEFSLAMLGAVPFLGKGIKLTKLGQKVKGAVDRAGNAASKTVEDSRMLLDKLDELNRRFSARREQGTDGPVTEGAARQRTGDAFPPFDGKAKLAELRAQVGAANVGKDPTVVRLLKKRGPGRFLEQQKALRQWAEMLNRDIGPGESVSLARMASDNPALKALSPLQLREVQGHLSQITGDVAQIHMRAILEKGRMADFVDGLQDHSMVYGIKGRPNRIADAVLAKDVEERTLNILGKKISRMTTKDREENEALFVELKAAAAKHRGTQKKTDDLINKTGAAIATPKTQKIAGKELEEGPEISEATLVRLHVNELPKDLYMATLMEGLSENGFSDDVVAGVLEGVEEVYRLDPVVRKQISLKTAITASFATAAALSLMAEGLDAEA